MPCARRGRAPRRRAGRPLGSGVTGGRLGDAAPVLGVGHEVVAEGRRGAEHGEQPVRGPGRGAAARRRARPPVRPRPTRRRGGAAPRRAGTPSCRTRLRRARSGSATADEGVGQAVAEDVVERVDQPRQRAVPEQLDCALRVGEPQSCQRRRLRGGAAGDHGATLRSRRAGRGCGRDGLSLVPLPLSLNQHRWSRVLGLPRCQDRESHEAPLPRAAHW